MLFRSRAWKAVVLINLALVVGVGCGYVSWGLRARRLERELAATRAAAAGVEREWSVERSEERRRRGGRRGAQPGGQQQRGERLRHARPPHLAFSIAVIITFGGTPRNVNRTASPTRIESVIFGEAARKPMVIAGM